MGKLPLAQAVSRRAVIAAGLAGAAAACTPKPIRPGPAIVETSLGKIEGVRENGVYMFRGVPYGAPTSGSARFLPPQPPAPWTGVRQTFAPGAPCPQPRRSAQDAEPSAPRSLLPSPDTSGASEDCLSLNVWTSGLGAGRRPVLVWLHAGGFSTGSGVTAWTDGAAIARAHDAIVVSLNHRLNVFGHLHLGPIFGDAYADSANAGMLDIVLALKWVRDNIENFGGDSNAVMIFGSGGGGLKTSVMMNLIPAQGLFHRAAVQDGSALRMNSQAVASDRTDRFLRKLGVTKDDLAKLQTMPADQLLAAFDPTTSFRPTIETPSLASHPFDPEAPLISADVPMIIGSNRTAASLTLGLDPKLAELDAGGLLERMRAFAPPAQVVNVFSNYKRLYPEASPTEILYMVATDREDFLDSTIQAERKLAQERAPVYYYGFYRESPVEGGRYFAPQASEIPFIFDNLAAAIRIAGEPGPESEKLANLMSESWVTFARSGDPTTDGLPEWPSYNIAERPTMIFDIDPRVENDPRSEQREMMAKFGSKQLVEPRVAPIAPPEVSEGTVAEGGVPKPVLTIGGQPAPAGLGLNQPPPR